MRDLPDPTFRPPKPASRRENATWFQRIKLFRQDVFSSQPERLYKAKLAQFKTPFYDSFLVNTPKEVRRVLSSPNQDFPKSTLVASALRDLLGNSVFVANGQDWARARRIIDPVFEAGKVRQSLPLILEAGQASVERLKTATNPVEIEAETSRLAADVMFRVMFSRPITDQHAAAVFDAFQDYQRSQPLWNLADLLRLPGWVPRFRNRRTRTAAAKIRGLLIKLVNERLKCSGPWPDDMLTGLIQGEDTDTGARFTQDELVDQIAIFFLAGHETSASALSWALYLLAMDQNAQNCVLDEAEHFDGNFKNLSKLPFTRNVFRETLRLYPPVPLMLRDATLSLTIRNRRVKKGALIILSPWHLGRHLDLWDNPDDFDPGRWANKTNLGAYIPFSAGDRVCAGAGFAMAEGVVLLSTLVRSFTISPIADQTPVPVAHLTLRSKDGIWLDLTPR